MFWLDKIEAASRVGVSPASCYEIALAHNRGRIELPSTAQEWFEASLTNAGIELFPLTEVVAVCAVELSPIHKIKLSTVRVSDKIAKIAILLESWIS